MSKHAILAAAKDLLWETGYEAMSPRLVMDRSVTGQGSLYHHFKSKSALAAAALEEIAEELTAALDAAFDPARPPLARIEAYLRAERDGLKGCKLGRFAMEAVIGEAKVRAPIEAYFHHLQAALTQAVTDARAGKEQAGAPAPQDIAAAIIATVQGGHILSRVHKDSNAINRATMTAMAMVRQALG